MLPLPPRWHVPPLPLLLPGAPPLLLVVRGVVAHGAMVQVGDFCQLPPVSLEGVAVTRARASTSDHLDDKLAT